MFIRGSRDRRRSGLGLFCEWLPDGRSVFGEVSFDFSSFFFPRAEHLGSWGGTVLHVSQYVSVGQARRKLRSVNAGLEKPKPKIL